MLFADLNLACRIEATDARAGTEYAHEMARLRPDSGATAISIAGGAAVYAGVGSPVTQAMGLALHGPVTEEEFDTLESFFRNRGCRVEIEVCPLADESLLALLGQRGYCVFEWSNVLIQPISAEASTPPLAAGIQIRRARSEDTDDLVGIMATCFLEQEEVTREAHDLFTPSLGASGGAWFVGIVDSQTVGCAGLFIYGGVAFLAGAATLPAYRGRGIQNALSRRRLEYAASVGCDLAVVMTKPGSTSQRNAERQGFRVVYTRSKMASEWNA